MRLLFSFYLLLFSTSILLFQSSCADPCEGVVCQNEGICNDGSCACPDNFIGPTCDEFDFSRIQNALDEGYTPKQLIDLDVPHTEIIGKLYEGGYIFYLDEGSGTGMVAATEDLPISAAFGCPSFDIPGILSAFLPHGIGEYYTELIVDACPEPNISARLCLDLVLNGKDDWFLPEIYELLSVKSNLADSDGDEFINGIDDPNNIGSFSAKLYGSSSQSDGMAAAVDFSNGNNTIIRESKSELLKIRPVRIFE